MSFNKPKRIVITGAAGFIGSVLAGYLNKNGYSNLILVDDFSRADKKKNYEGKDYEQLVDRSSFFDWAREQAFDAILHMGARTDTAETDEAIFKELNLDYSKRIWQLCTERQIPLIYASSAATYGSGEHGYSDDHQIIPSLRPLNPYGWSKQQFDLWALEQDEKPPFWTGLKFFNVYGPNEYHKGRMASVVFHAYNQINETGTMKLFRSHRPDFEDGRQMRDFIYVPDVVDVILFLLENQPANGIFNLGSGRAQTFLQLTHAVFNALDKEPNIEFIDTPADIRDNYQYFTEAAMDKLRAVGYRKHFRSLVEAVTEYVIAYCKHGVYYLGIIILFCSIYLDTLSLAGAI
jgi:ADP-L-glycero-D-manno-heptose 6-epimerase